MPIDLALEQARAWVSGPLPIDLHDTLAALLTEIECLRQPAPPPAKVIRCAQVDVDGEAVTLTFQADLTPIEAVAAFLRDAADACATGPDGMPGRDLLYEIADQLDPPATLPVAAAAGNSNRTDRR